MSDAFSTPAVHAISQEVDTDAEAGPSASSTGDQLGGLSIEEAFEVDETVRLIESYQYKTVSHHDPQRCSLGSDQWYHRSVYNSRMSCCPSPYPSFELSRSALLTWEFKPT